MLQRSFNGCWVIRLEKGDSVIESVAGFCEERGIGAGTFSGIGAVTRARLGYFDQVEDSYVESEFEEELEIVSLTGNISRKSDGTLFPHTHCVLSDREMKVVGGHLFEAVVGPTVEIYLWTVPGELRRAIPPGESLELLDL